MILLFLTLLAQDPTPAPVYFTPVYDGPTCEGERHCYIPLFCLGGEDGAPEDECPWFFAEPKEG